MWPDMINATFELLGGFAIMHHCLCVLKDKAVAGVSIYATIFFSAWGFWNVFYYPHLDQFWSFYAGIFIVLMNSWWVFLLLKYRHRKHKVEAV